MEAASQSASENGAGDPGASSPAEGDSPNQLTIDELARRTGLSVRNIRDHQTRGLLQPPEVRSRTGYYGPDHVERLEMIRELQAEGFNLKGIKRLLDESGDTRSLRTLRQSATAPFATEAPQIVSLEELAERFGEDAAEHLDRAVQLGALVPIGDDRYEAPVPSLLDAAAKVAATGIGLGEAIEVLARVSRHAESVSEIFVGLFLEQIWKPFSEGTGGEGSGDWQKVIDSVEELRPVASEALLSIFQLRMSDTVEDAIGKELARYSKRKG